MGKSKANSLPMIGLCMLILPIMAGCAPAHFRAHPQLQEKVQSIKTVAIMPPSVKVYELAVGGGTQLMDEPTVAATQIVSAAIEKELGRHAGVVFKPFPSPTAILATSSDLAAAGLKDELEDTQALFDTVSASVWLHTYPHQGKGRDPDFPEKLKNFDYSLGPEVQRLATLANADALLFISGVDHIPTGGRAALMGLGVVVGALFLRPDLVVAAATAGGPATLSVALVDATTGALLWYNFNFRRGGNALADPDYAADLLEEAFKDFPVGGRPTRTRTRNEYDWSCSPSCPQAGGGQPPR